MNKNIKIISEKLSNARFRKKFINKIPPSIIQNVKTATEICRNAEMRLLWNPIGFKAGATNKAVWKKLKTSSPFFSYLYEETTYKNNTKAPFQQNLLGAELEIAFKIKNELFNFNKTMKYYNLMQNVGKAKYLLHFHDGTKKHKDGSNFYDIKIFKNKIKLNTFIKEES